MWINSFVCQLIHFTAPHKTYLNTIQIVVNRNMCRVCLNCMLNGLIVCECSFFSLYGYVRSLVLLHGSQVIMLKFSSWSENHCEIGYVNHFFGHHEIGNETEKKYACTMIYRCPMVSLGVCAVWIGNVICSSD